MIYWSFLPYQNCIQTLITGFLCFLLNPTYHWLGPLGPFKGIDGTFPLICVDSIKQIIADIAELLEIQSVIRPGDNGSHKTEWSIKFILGREAFKTTVCFVKIWDYNSMIWILCSNPTSNVLDYSITCGTWARPWSSDASQYIYINSRSPLCLQ